MEYIQFFQIAPAWATLLILGILALRKMDFNKMFGRQMPPEPIFVRREDCHKHIDDLMGCVKGIKDDIREVRATILKHIEKGN